MHELRRLAHPYRLTSPGSEDRFAEESGKSPDRLDAGFGGGLKGSVSNGFTIFSLNLISAMEFLLLKVALFTSSFAKKSRQMLMFSVQKRQPSFMHVFIFLKFVVGSFPQPGGIREECKKGY